MSTDMPGAGNLVYAGLSQEPLHLDRALNAVQNDECGAVVSFSGVVRNHDAGKQVSRLSYSGHPTAERVIGQLGTEFAQRFPATRIWVAHRLGDLAIGDPALVCAVAAAHRGEAFAVCTELVDAVKARVPIWKEQYFADGEVEWVGAS